MEFQLDLKLSINGEVVLVSFLSRLLKDGGPAIGEGCTIEYYPREWNTNPEFCWERIDGEAVY
jgi:hypothetical protein